MAFWNKSASEPKAEAPLACSFCGKTQQQVQQLIAGPACYICDGCVRLSMDLVEPAVEVPAPQPSEAALRTAMATRVCGLRPQISLLARITAANAQGDGRPPTVLLVGAPGVGKTALCEALVEGCGLPAAHAHVHRITATGYIGADLENIVQQVVLAAGDHRHHADRGLLVLEDLHHLGLRSPVATLARDVGGRDVQPHLVRLLDRRVLYLPDDPAQRLHPMQSAAQYDPAGLLVLLTCRLDALPDGCTHRHRSHPGAARPGRPGGAHGPARRRGARGGGHRTPAARGLPHDGTPGPYGAR